MELSEEAWAELIRKEQEKKKALEQERRYTRSTFFPFATKNSVMAPGPAVKFAAPEVVKSLIEAITAPRDAYRGELDVNSPEAVERALNVPLAMGAAGAVRNVGRTAAPNVLGAMVAPADMLPRGASRFTLPVSKKEVGLLGSPGQERIVEKALPAAGQQVTRALGEVYSDPMIFDRFPQMRDTKLTLRNVEGQTGSDGKPISSGGSFNPMTGDITAEYKGLLGPKGLLGILDHEGTHSIAKRAGLPGGSNFERGIDQAKRLREAMALKYGIDPKQLAELAPRMLQEDKEVLRRLALLGEGELSAGTKPGMLQYLATEGEWMARLPQFMRNPAGGQFERPMQDIAPYLLHNSQTPRELGDALLRGQIAPKSVVETENLLRALNRAMKERAALPGASSAP